MRKVKEFLKIGKKHFIGTSRQPMKDIYIICESSIQCGGCILCRGGRGVDKDVDQSFIWWKKSADQGYSVAQCNVGKGC